MNGRPRLPDVDNYCRNCGHQMERKRYNGVLEDRAIFTKRRYCDRDCAIDAKAVARLEQSVARFK